jgi:hypothetical protein
MAESHKGSKTESSAALSEQKKNEWVEMPITTRSVDIEQDEMAITQATQPSNNASFTTASPEPSELLIDTSAQDFTYLADDPQLDPNRDITIETAKGILHGEAAFQAFAKKDIDGYGGIGTQIKRDVPEQENNPVSLEISSLSVEVNLNNATKYKAYATALTKRQADGPTADFNATVRDINASSASKVVATTIINANATLKEETPAETERTKLRSS